LAHHRNLVACATRVNDVEAIQLRNAFTSKMRGLMNLTETICKCVGV